MTLKDVIDRILRYFTEFGRLGGWLCDIGWR